MISLRLSTISKLFVYITIVHFNWFVHVTEQSGRSSANFNGSNTTNFDDIPQNEVLNWALKIGVDLWEFGKQITRVSELHKRYEDSNIRVNRKDGLVLIREATKEIRNMLDFKINALKRIVDSAEQASISYYHDFNNKLPEGMIEKKLENTFSSNSIPNSHFDNLLVNFSISSIVLSNDIDSTDKELQNVVNWSENLNAIFINNYESDPSLSWQYFGSATGFSRTYPGNIKSFIAKKEYTPDFRLSSWYINTITSPKDMIILIDNSGSMTGSHSKLARNLIFEIIDSLNINDFVNIFKFSKITEELVPCYKNLLLQANYENKRILKSALNTLDPENVANFTSALITAFELLQKYNRSGQGSQCNQVIMLITDDIKSDYKEVIKTYNWPHTPVRIFTYLIGSDFNNWENLKSIACTNKGYFSSITNANQIKGSILQYLNVISRPLILYHNSYPIAWTPIAYNKLGINNDKMNKVKIAITTPVYDRKKYSKKVTSLLGVVGTDVLLDEIKKLIPPFKIGVGAYTFLVDNNGQVIDHPNLRLNFAENTFSKSDYFSVDLTEVESMENELSPRENNSYLIDLRNDMVDQKEGETELTVKIPYDNMRRTFRRRQKYFYRPIENTPFSLALVLPHNFGFYDIVAEQEIKHSQINVTEFFIGKNWRINPNWVYCEYYNEAKMNQLFQSAEEKMLHFLMRTYRPGWKWMSLRPRFPSSISHHQKHIHIDKVDKKSHYCDKSLIQSLVLDAIVTNKIEQHGKHNFRSQDRHQGYKMFGLSRSFVSTRSGLLRWTDHSDLKNDNLTAFINEYSRSIEGTWYQKAVDYHKIESNSFVFSVPFGIKDDPNALVTATHAIFAGSKGHKAPMAVVGLQFQHSIFAAHFLNITSTCTSFTSACTKTCGSDDLDCYVLDDNGYVIISEHKQQTGLFFGEIDGTIMDSLIQDKIYRKTELYDYQCECSVKSSTGTGNVFGSSASKFHSRTNLIGKFMNSIVYCLIFALIQLNTIYASLIESTTNFDFSKLNGNQNTNDYRIDDEYASTADDDDVSGGGGGGGGGNDDDDNQFDYATIVPSIKTNYYSHYNKHVDYKKFNQKITESLRLCDKKIELYELQIEKLHANGKNYPLKGKLTNCNKFGCEKSFSLQKIPHSNLILLVVDNLCPCGNKKLPLTEKEIVYKNSLNVSNKFHGYLCRQNKFTMHRKRPLFCSNYHPEETEIKVCSFGSRLQANNVIEMCAIIIAVMTAVLCY